MATWSCNKLINKYNKLANYLTPIKAMALTVLILGIVNNLTGPLQHALDGNMNYNQTPLEIFIRIFFVFCGIFGLMGNGKTKRIRATVVSLPLLYLASFYSILLLQYNNNAFIAFIGMSGIPGIWMLLFGDNYDK